MMMRHSRGPVMTPEIQELELELQLLKRKRQLLQHEQEMLIGGHQSNRQRQHDYFDPSCQRYSQQQNQDFDFSHLYDDRPGSSNRGRQFGQKRHSNDPWDDNGPAKRFHGSQGKPKSSPGPRSYQGFGSNKRGGSNIQQRSSGDYQREPLRNADSRPGERNVPIRSSTFRGARVRSRPNKVTKPRTTAPPNKLNSYPTSERKKLINETGVTANDDSIILSADKPPTPTQLGRMELALGNILKELRNNFSDTKHQELFQSDFFVKLMKQTLRERIRRVMIGHPILNMKTIIEMYREKFSKETDQEIIHTALEVANTSRRLNTKRLAIKLVPAETPENYFRLNMGKLINLKLDEMFDKLEKVYASENGELQPMIDANMPSETTEVDPNAKTSEDKYDPADAFQNVDQPNDTFNDNVIVIEDGNDSAANTDASLLANENKDTLTADNSCNDNKTVMNDGKENKEEKEEKPTEELNKTNSEDEITEVDAKFLKTWKLLNSKYLTHSFYERLIHKSLTYKLPRILPTFKDHIVKILNIDQQYRDTKAAIVGKVTRDIEPKDHPHSGENYYVKIIARPGLPKRRLMTRFLESYNPLSIKKHKTVHNLLFIRLRNKDDFDRILETSGTRIGSAVLTITVSDWKNKNQDSNQQIDFTKDADPTVKIDDKSIEPPLMSNDLENQITDLLSSIRKEETSIKSEINTDSTQNKEDLENVDEKKEKQEKEEVEENAESGEAKEDKDEDVTTKTDTENYEQSKEEMEKNDNNEKEAKNETANNEQIEATKSEEKKVPATPTRSSTRLSTTTPSSITTRRASKLT